MDTQTNSGSVDCSNPYEVLGFVLLASQERYLELVGNGQTDAFRELGKTVRCFSVSLSQVVTGFDELSDFEEDDEEIE